MIFQNTQGVFETVIDFTLFLIFLSGGLLGFRSKRDLFSSFSDASKLLEKINYKTFWAALQALKRKKLVQEIKQDQQSQVFLTSTGLTHLSTFLPTYQLRRPWDGKIYLITYDIPEHRHVHRDLLRNYLKVNLSAAFLQKSVFLTPYNPRRHLFEFAETHRLHGTILVSELNKDGTISDLTVPKILQKLYSLDELGRRYQNFIKKWRGFRKNSNRLELEFDFYSILLDDSQLPFELLPPNFPSDKAFTVYQKLTQKF